MLIGRDGPLRSSRLVEALESADRQAAELAARRPATRPARPSSAPPAVTAGATGYRRRGIVGFQPRPSACCCRSARIPRWWSSPIGAHQQLRPTRRRPALRRDPPEPGYDRPQRGAAAVRARHRKALENVEITAARPRLERAQASPLTSLRLDRRPRRATGVTTSDHRARDVAGDHRQRAEGRARHRRSAGVVGIRGELAGGEAELGLSWCSPSMFGARSRRLLRVLPGRTCCATSRAAPRPPPSPWDREGDEPAWKLAQPDPERDDQRHHRRGFGRGHRRRALIVEATNWVPACREVRAGGRSHALMFPFICFVSLAAAVMGMLNAAPSPASRRLDGFQHRLHG